MTARLRVTVGLALLALPSGLAAQQGAKVPKDPTATMAASLRLPALIWRDPGDMASLNLLYGAGGKAHAPALDGKFVFVREDRDGTSPKFEVTDAQGVGWKVKLGSETRGETVASRFLWAAGYLVDEDYYLAEMTVQGMPKLHRGRSFVSADGIVHGARLKRKLSDATKVVSWDWSDNPFVGQQQLNGLRIMMSFLNNWDLKTANNSIVMVGGERRYQVSDIGATFGQTGGVVSRSKGVPADYEDSNFIASVRPDFVDFVQKGKLKAVTRNIPRADAKWLAQRLVQLTEEQIRDAFRAGGRGAADVDLLTKAVQKRIAALKGL